jgi:hypothetical protein
MDESLRLRAPFRYQVTQLAEAEIACQAEAASLQLDGQREEAVELVVDGLMDGQSPADPEDPVGQLALQAQEAILARAREPGHGDLVLHMLLSHRFRRRLEPTLPEHTIQALLGWARLGRYRARRPAWGSRKLT